PPALGACEDIPRDAAARRAEGHHAAAAGAVFDLAGWLAAFVAGLTARAQPAVGEDFEPLARDRFAATVAAPRHAPGFVVLGFGLAGREPNGATLGTSQLAGGGTQ